MTTFDEAADRRRAEKLGAAAAISRENRERAKYHVSRRGRSAPKAKVHEDVSLFGDELPEPEPTERKLVEIDGWPDYYRDRRQ
jgi:hypothetical protein